MPVGGSLLGCVEGFTGKVERARDGGGGRQKVFGADVKAWNLGKVSLWEEWPVFQKSTTEGVKGRDGFRLWRPQALVFSKATPPRHIRHIKIYPHCILNMSYI